MNEIDVAVYIGIVLALLWIVRWARRAINRASAPDRSNTHKLQ